MQQQEAYPVRFKVDYPDRPLNRADHRLPIFVAIPIMIVLGTVSGGGGESSTTPPGPPPSPPAGCCSSGRS